MRPLLKLKKQIEVPAPQTAPPSAPAKPVKSAKRARASLAKEQQRLENIRLGAQAAARRRAQLASVEPLVKAYLLGKPALTTPVVLEGRPFLRPLYVGIGKAVLTWLRAQPQALGCGNTVLNDAISSVLQPHVDQPRYIASLLKFEERFDLDGNAVGVVSARDKARAARKLTP